MEKIIFNTEKSFGSFRILNAVNGGPWHKRHANDQYRTNIADYTAARIPFSRNHDSAMCGIYGGPYSHDITCIFPDFSADENDPASYDFACTDEAILVALDAGTKTFFRLGQTIEHQIKKHGTLPPADFKKWAVICEHIIRHYTEGWANGFTHDMPYWEIWNEPDLDRDDSTNKRCWGGTKAQFFDFYEIAAKHLKARFPNLKIGGPALAGKKQWAEDFLSEMKKRGAPLDFFSWHIYTTSPLDITDRAEQIRELLDSAGFTEAESILNEWNYNCGWGERFVESLKTIHGVKGAAFTMAAISAAEPSSIDMLMYYDTRPSVFCGAFDFYTYEKLPGYYPLFWYGTFYDMEKVHRAENLPCDIYSLCGSDKGGKVQAVITYYTDKADAPEKEIALDFGKSGKFEVFTLAEGSDPETPAEADSLCFTMKPNTCLFIKEKRA